MNGGRFSALWVLLVSAAGQAAAGPVIINEIHCAPADKTVREEFVELYNRGAAPVDLSGWYFSEGIDYTFSGVTISPGEYIVVAEDPGVVRSLYGASIRAFGPFRGRLANGGERIVLRNRDGFREDEVDYGRAFPWPTAGGGTGYSIELAHPDLDNDLGGSWRLSNPGIDSSNQLIREGEVWRYFKGTREASSPRDAWRQPGFDDAGWPAGRASIGYGESFVRTELDDMRNNYSSVFLRKTFEVADPSAVRFLELQVQYDDGFNAWINGVHVAGANVSSDELAYDATANSAIENHDFESFSLPRPVDYVTAGTNVFALQLFNASLGGSSDAFADLRLSSTAGSGAGPTPGARNSVFAENIAPQMRQVAHSPEQPVTNQIVFVTVKATDPDGVASVRLEYQVVEPGRYIELEDPAYATDWTAVAMRDDGAQGDLAAGDGVYSALLPRSLQVHRRLIRYRIIAADTTGLSVEVPYADDPQPNFAYFVYDGVPGWSGAVRPGVSAVIDYPPEVLRRLPTYHLISKRSDVEDATWYSKYGGSEYLWRGTLVYDGDVYDHIRYRARGGVWRYAMGKNMWKFNFYRGHRFQAHDDFGREYGTRWDKLNFSAVIQQGDYRHRGEQGLFESTGFKLFNLAGVEAPKTHFVQFQIVDEEDELGATQYQGDLWGLYLAVEQMDGEFLDEHGLPDGNFYKMEGGTGELNNQGYTAVKDKSDLNSFLNTYQNTSPSDDWWRSNLDLPRYYGYRSILEAIHHYDVGYGKNYFYYLDPERDIWQVHPWDIDLTWADNMFGNGDEPFRSRVLSRSGFLRDYRNRLREIRDLLYNTDQAYQLIDEFAAMIDDPGGGLSIVDVDRSLWDYNPIMVNSSIVNLSKAGHGRFYESGTTRTFPGMVQLMKNYVVSRGRWIDTNILNDSAIPDRPSVLSTSPPGFPVDALTFRSNAFSDPQGSSTFGAMKWRIAEVTPDSAPPYDPEKPRRYEINAVWESGEISPFERDISIPPEALEIGATYRVRVRMMDTSGRWSHWSAPVEFVAGAPTAPFPQQEHLRVTEVMYNPPQGADYEFVEFLNIGPEPLDLRPVVVSGGIDFRFAESDVETLAAGEYLVLVENREVFSAVYGSEPLIGGVYSRRLSNGGDRITVRYGSGATILDFEYSDRWYPLTDGLGHSLVVVDALDATSVWSSAAGWRESSEIGGSPGRGDGAPPPGGRQLPGDGNQDGAIDLSDAIALLLHLFGGGAISLPCEGASAGDGGNRTLLDVNGDAGVNITDAVHLMLYLFRGGPAPALGTECVRIEGCPTACGF